MFNYNCPEGVFPTRMVTPYEWQYQAILKETLGTKENSYGFKQAIPYAMLNVDLTSDLPLLKSMKVNVDEAKRLSIQELHSSELNLEKWVNWCKASDDIDTEQVGPTWVRQTTLKNQLAWMVFKGEITCSISMYNPELVDIVPLYMASYAFLTMMLATEMHLTASHLSVTLLAPYVSSDNMISAEMLLERMNQLENVSYITGSLEDELSQNNVFASYFNAINNYPTFFLRWGLDEPQSIFTIDESAMKVSDYKWVDEGV